MSSSLVGTMTSRVYGHGGDDNGELSEKISPQAGVDL